MSDIYNSKTAAIVGRLNGAKNGYAVTISSNCTLYSAPEDRVSPQLRTHEDCHKAQIKELGWFTFMRQYAIESAKNGYTNNKFEVAARKASQTDA